MVSDGSRRGQGSCSLSLLLPPGSPRSISEICEMEVLSKPRRPEDISKPTCHSGRRNRILWIPSSSAWLVGFSPPLLRLLQVLLLVACEGFRSSLLKSYISCGQSWVGNTAHCWQVLMRNAPRRESSGSETGLCSSSRNSNNIKIILHLREHRGGEKTTACSMLGDLY